MINAGARFPVRPGQTEVASALLDRVSQNGSNGSPLTMSKHFNEICTHLETWYQGDKGRYLLGRLQVELDRRLDNAFGYHILQAGPLRSQALFGGSRIHHRIRACERAGEGIGLVCDGDALPLESDSVDVIIALHPLEISPNPHQILRELQRVLTPQGQLFLVGWNPYSPAGILERLRALAPRSPWRGQTPVSAGRLGDWLSLLGCEVENTSYLYHLPPLGTGRLRNVMQRLDRWCGGHNLPLGGMYLVHAIKQVPANRGPRPVWRRDRLIGLTVPSPVSAPGAAPGLPHTGSAVSRKKQEPVLH